MSRASPHIVKGLLLALVLVAGMLSPVGAQVTKTTLRLAFATTPSFEEVPIFLAGERLRVQGIEFEPVVFGQPSLGLAALVRGDIDVAYPSISSAEPLLVERRLIYFLTKNLNPWVLYARREIAQCRDLNGRRVGLQNTTGVSAALFKYWLPDRCPGVTPSIVTIPGASTRAAAMAAGQLEAAMVGLEDVIQLDHLYPGQFHRLADFSKEVPFVATGYYGAAPASLANRRDVLKAFTRELIKVFRLAAADPRIIADVAPRYVRVLDPSMLPALARAYAEVGIWPTRGGFTPEALARAVRFHEDSGTVKPGLKATRIADFSIIRDVLQELGN